MVVLCRSREPMTRRSFPLTLRIAHSPDADDRFMFWPIKENLITIPSQIHFSFIEADTQTLNSLASSPFGPDICAISAIHYKKVFNHYQPLLMGTSLGEGYGPIVVCKYLRQLHKNKKNRGILLSPGEETTAHEVLKYLGYEFDSVEVVPITPMEQMFEVMDKYHKLGHEVAALLIHEGRLSYNQYGAHNILDIGALWKEKTGASLPLGINVIRRQLAPDIKHELSALFDQSFAFAKAHKETFIQLCHKNYSPYYSPLPPHLLGAYLDLYANDKTRCLPEEDKEAFRALVTYDGGPHIPLDWV